MSDSKLPKNPIQPLVMVDGVLRFKQNNIVAFLLAFAAEHGVNMNELAVMDFSDDDRAHFAQLIGYSVSGFSELSYVSNKLFNKVMCEKVE